MDVADLELLRARVKAARNSPILSPTAINAIKTADTVDISHAEISNGQQFVIVRRYVLSRTWTRKSKALPVYGNAYKVTDTPTGSYFTTVSGKDHLATLWEVEQRGRIIDSSASFLYEDADGALAAYLYVLGTAFQASEEKASPSQLVDLQELLGHIYRDTLRLTGATIPQGQPFLTPEGQSGRASLEARAIEARTIGASAALRKEIAARLYEQGERNIRRLSLLTGLARDTIYRALDAYGIQRKAEDSLDERKRHPRR
ncbi:helix-turn-helix domain-containing protein [Microbispora triticiradicis]|uniref:Uncharacterized protein n=2 Tax=Microbispora TaxID=2005 RepID=A0ABY3M4J6_9ACTN|nr:MULTISPECIES: helix-turn-helix domain-containing protein [Microbispora]TLP57010.1 hypothetical protein FED44_21580 [Microbispora fusca]TYB66966.1 hypothetical protein FXF59_04020 [Microbispora tritici]